MDNQTDQTQAPAEQPATIAPDQDATARTPGTPEAPATDTGTAAPADQVEQARIHMNLVLELLREKRDQLNPNQPGGRELSEAITLFETGCMWMLRSQYADQPYSPLTRLQPATE